MSINSRAKGRQAEQEVARILSDHLGIKLTRNWQQQAAQGGADLIGLDDWAIEIKHCKQYLNAWWQQAETQAEAIKAKPVLIYRITGANRGLPELHKWQAEVRASDYFSNLKFQTYRITMPLGCWLALVRDELNQEEL
jgi:hypothetical protein